MFTTIQTYKKWMFLGRTIEPKKTPTRKWEKIMGEKGVEYLWGSVYPSEYTLIFGLVKSKDDNSYNVL